MSTYDTIIIGLGGMGAAAAWASAQRGHKVLGLEQFSFVHDLGSSHGHSRIIREAYYEHPAYVPLVQESFRLWKALELQSDQSLLSQSACANIGLPGSEIIEGIQQAAREHLLDVETWDARLIRQNIPALHVPDDYVGIIEANAGWIKVEDSIRSMLDLASQLGAKLHAQEQVLEWKATNKQVEVLTSQARYTASHLIITAGPWAGSLLNELQLPLSVMRQVQLWFTPPASNGSQYSSPTMPIFIMDTPEGDFYSIPADAGPGIKLAQHYGAPELNSPDAVDRTLQQNDIAPVRRFMQHYMPGLANAPLSASAVCMYTLSPDRHFIIDRHPHYERVALACGFSGHGFKFAPVVGSMLADLVTDQGQRPPLFAIDRL